MSLCNTDPTLQENYLKTNPARLKNDSGPERELKQLELMEKASSSISDGDLVDALIHGCVQSNRKGSSLSLPMQVGAALVLDATSLGVLRRTTSFIRVWYWRRIR